MQKTKLLVAVLGAFSTLPVLAADAPVADFTPSSNVAIVSNYLYRGISQTGANPALQGGFDMVHKSGAYIGVWSSSISFLSDSSTATSAGTEFDTFLGYKGKAGNIGYDVGFLRYNYPGDYGTNIKADTNEYYVAATYSIVTAKVSYATSNLFGVEDSKGSTYMELNATYPIPETSYTLTAHVGKQAVKGSAADTSEAAGKSYSYTDYKVGVSRDFSGYIIGLAYSSTDASPIYTSNQNKELGKRTTVVSLSRTFE